MRTIPASIINKLKSLQQTKANNADPRINLVMQRTKRYIEQGSEMQPLDLWQRPGLGPLAVAIRREDRLKGRYQPTYEELKLKNRGVNYI